MSAKNGKPAAYHQDNVPYQPASHLKVNADGVKAGDGVFVAGYPGSTSRYRLTSELKFASDWLYPVLADRYQRQIDTLEAMGANSSDIKIKYAGMLAGNANRMKKLNGLLDGFRSTDIAGIKQQREDDFTCHIDRQGANSKAMMQTLERLITERQAQYQTRFYFNNAQSGALLDAAKQLYRLAKEQQKPDAEREAGYQQRDLRMFAAKLTRLNRSFDAEVDRTLWQQDIEAYRDQSHRVEVLDKLLLENGTQPLAERLRGMYSLTGLMDTDTRLA